MSLPTLTISWFFHVLIVAECNVNLDEGTGYDETYFVLIVAECNVNSDIGRLYSLLGKF